jgi:membrane protease subunit HflK
MSDDFKGRGGSPWGAPPGGGGNGSGRGPTPPDIDAIIRDIQKKINKFLPGGSKSGGKPIGLILIVLVFVWLASGLYRVLPDEQGVVLRFGKFVKTTQPGLNYHIPFPVETVETPKVTKVNRMDIGFRSERESGFSSGGGVADVPQESLMLTGDENIVNIDFSVFWVIKDAGKFLFEIQDPEGTVKAAAETAMREVIAKSDIQPILTEGRAKIEIETQEIIQSILDEYQSGIQVTQVQTQKADPPIRLLMHLEMYKLQERIWKDLKMKPKHMLTMSSQEQEGKRKRFYKLQKLIKIK